MTSACDMLGRLCVAGIEADEERCRRHVNSSTASATALLPVLGYDGMCDVIRAARSEKKTVRDVVVSRSLLTADQFDELISPEAVCRLGTSHKKLQER